MGNKVQAEAWAFDAKLQGMADSTINQYSWVLRSAPFELPGTLAEAKAWLAELQAKGLSEASIINRIRALKRYSAWWAEMEDQADPLSRLKYPKVQEAEPGRIASDEDYYKVMAQLKYHKGANDVRDKALLSTFFYTGMRRGEIARMKVEHLDFELVRIAVPFAKGGKFRYVPMHPKLAYMLRIWLKRREKHPLASSPWLWLGERGALKPDSLSGVLDRLSKRYGIDPPLRAHTYRRRFATVWVKRGGNDPELMLVAGWTNPTMAGRYRKAHMAELAQKQFHEIFAD